MTDDAAENRFNPGIWSRARTPLSVASRHAAALLGSWWFACGFVALATFGLTGAGMAFEEARLLAWMLGFLLLLGGTCWAYTPRSVWFPWLVLGGGGAAMGSAAWLLSRMAP